AVRFRRRQRPADCRLREDSRQFLARGGKRAEAGIESPIRQREIKVAERAADSRMTAERQAILRACDDGDHATGLMNIGFRVLVHVNKQSMVEHCAVTFGNGFQLSDQVGKFLDMPAADVPQNSLAFGSGRSWRLSVMMGVIVMAGGGVSQPGESSDPL